MRIALAIGVLIWASAANAQSTEVETSPRPVARPIATAVVEAREPAPVPNPGFRRWIGQFRKRALAQGIRARVFDDAFEGVSYDASIIDKDRNQSEFTKQIWEYLDAAVSDKRVENGRTALSDNAPLLDEIEALYGVEKEVVAAIWGLESAYGAFRGDIPIIEALATLSFDARRGAFFEKQLIAALQILQAGDTTAANMTGSWAGAMGHTQFMPTSYLAYAQDFNGDGRRNIWSDDPADALASTAAYLARFGWTKGQPWGMEVVLPNDFDYSILMQRAKRPTRDWVEMGVRSADGVDLPEYHRASILLPAGHKGAAFIVFNNFHVIERYNAADAYVIGVGHLADRLRGASGIRASWPRDDRALSFSERQEMQRRLQASGFDPKGQDGIIGPRTLAALRAYQSSVGLVPDGFASLNILEQLR